MRWEGWERECVWRISSARLGVCSAQYRECAVVVASRTTTNLALHSSSEMVGRPAGLKKRCLAFLEVGSALLLFRRFVRNFMISRNELILKSALDAGWVGQSL